MAAVSILSLVLLVGGKLFADGATFSGGFGGYGGFINGGAVVGGGGGGYQCGQAQCMTQIQCDSCDYPQQFVQQVSYSRSILTRVEEFVQTIGKVAINVHERFASTAVAVPAGLIDVSVRNGMLLVNDISTAIENLNSFVSHQVVGRIAYDIVADLSDSLSVVRRLVGWCGSASSGTTEIQIPVDIVIRYQQPPTWNSQCQGAWPCSTLVPYTSSQGQQSQYSNKYAYGKQYSQGNTQIVNSNYDSGSAFGYGDTGSAANNYSYQTGSTPSQASGGNSGGGYPSNLLSGYGGYGGARSVGGKTKLGRRRGHRRP